MGFIVSEGSKKSFAIPEGNYAAALIDRAGLKGYRVGDAQVSEKHAGFVVNLGKASSHDVHRLMRDVRKKVYENSGVALEPEMIILPPDYRLEDKGPAVPLHFISSPKQEEDGQGQSGS